MPTTPSTEQAPSCVTLMIEREVSQIGLEPETTEKYERQCTFNDKGQLF